MNTHDPSEPDRQDNSTNELSALRQGFSSLYEGPMVVPSAMDQAMRRDIHSHFAGQIRRHSWPWRVMPWVAAAALITLTVLIWPQFQRVNSPQRSVARIEAADLDHSGRIDILDAFSLARRIEAGESIDAAADFNHDGKIDALDVNAIAMQAVALDPGRSGAS